MHALQLIPLPRHLAMSVGAYFGSVRVLRVHPADAQRLALQTMAKALGLRVQRDADLPAHTAVVGEETGVLAPAHAQGYGLRIATTGMVIHGRDELGLVWGLQTLRQILTQAKRPPCLEISDWPEYGIRYHHDDVSRKQISTSADFRRIIQQLASFKISHYTPYIEDVVQIPGIPLMGENRGAFTKDQLRDLVTEGKRWQVEVFPTLSLAGHQENLMQLPRYRGLGARTWQPPSSYDPSNPAVRAHLLKILDAVCPLFTSPLFHMCFDEILGMDADGFVAHANWCAKELVKRGKTPLLWADMLYNHFGCAVLKRLHPAIIPVAWDYSRSGGKARAAVKELLRYRKQAWILAGYNNWGSFLHEPLAETHEQWTNWRAVAPPDKVSAFGASQWGDDGYENSRDLGWPIFAACAEQGWSGDAAHAATVESRFQVNFHGHALPELTRVRRLLESGLAISPRQAWLLHRLPAPGWVRLARAGRIPTAVRLQEDVRRLAEAARLLAHCRTKAKREVAHLVHYQVAIDRLASVVARAQAARQSTRIAAAMRSLAQARRSYRGGWLAHNRAENIEVSLAVYEKQEASWRRLAIPEPRPSAPWHALNLGRTWNTCSHAIAGMPIGDVTIAGTPYRFPPINRTHAEIAPGKTVALSIPAVPIRDLHLVLTQPRDGETIRPGARLRLSRRGHVVYEEELLTIRHLCDWWAPLGEHMWAGGGFAYVDPLRVQYVLSPNPPYGLTSIQRFPWPAAPCADRLELTCLGSKPLQLFAITLEEAAR